MNWRKYKARPDYLPYFDNYYCETRYIFVLELECNHVRTFILVKSMNDSGLKSTFKSHKCVLRRLLAIVTALIVCAVILFGLVFLPVRTTSA